MNNLKAVGAFCGAILLSACAPTLSAYEMMPKSQTYDVLGENKALEKNITLGDVTVEKGLGGMTAPISADQYKEALSSALRLAGWYKAENGKYQLDAHLKEIDQPVIGFNFTVKAKAEYVLTERKTGKVRYDEELTLPCTVTMAEAFVADQRLRKATSCAVGENITHMLNVISAKH